MDEVCSDFEVIDGFAIETVAAKLTDADAAESLMTLLLLGYELYGEERHTPMPQRYCVRSRVSVHSYGVWASTWDGAVWAFARQVGL